MKISSDTKISKILKYNMEAVDVIASINSNFNKLRNPILRAVLAPRVSISDAAKIGKCDIQELFNALEKIGFVKEDNARTLKPCTTPTFFHESESLHSLIENRTCYTIDIRPFLDKNEDPFNTLMEHVKQLNSTNTLEVISPFEPIPLIRILSKKGYETLLINYNGLFKLYILQTNSISNANPLQNESIIEDEIHQILEKFRGKIEELDVRHLEMPLPFVTILEAIDTLKEDHLLFVHHKRIPQFLFPELTQKECDFQFFELADQTVELLIYKKDGGLTKQ